VKDSGTAQARHVRTPAAAPGSCAWRADPTQAV
jgi:hypothetical protein